MNMMPIVWHGLPRRLIDDGLIAPRYLEAAIKSAKVENISLIQYLCKSKMIAEKDIGTAAAKEFGIPIYAIDQHNLNSIPKSLIDHKLLIKHQVIPLIKRGNRLFVAIADPMDARALNDIQFQTGISVEPVLAMYSSIIETLNKLLKISRQANINEVSHTTDEYLSHSANDAPDDQHLQSTHNSTDDKAPIVRFINKLLIDAITLSASDIHFEPYEKNYRVRFRIDGILREMARPPINLARRIAARLKVMAHMDISERRLPQDGRVQLRLPTNQSIDIRFNTLPLQFGEKIVLRILDAANAQLGIDALGFDSNQKNMYLDALACPQGMILVTGPTGSGKTVSLYTGLGILNTTERNISTAEDPVEINMDGINQTQINTRVGLGFSDAMRAFLRQDPDIIMVGEIRDLETAEIAIKAAQTGHLVLSTLHTNNAPETLTRLLNMGVPAFNVATSVSLIIAQRLGRKLCLTCRLPLADLPDHILAEQGFDDIGINRKDITLFKAVGCPDCTSGYKGRIGIYEILKISPAITKIIMAGGSSLDIREIALIEGFVTLRVSALVKAAQGVISIEELNRITKD